MSEEKAVKVQVVNLGMQGITSSDGNMDILFMPDVPRTVSKETAERLTKKFNNPGMEVYFEYANISNSGPVVTAAKKRGRKAK